MLRYVYMCMYVYILYIYSRHLEISITVINTKSGFHPVSKCENMVNLLILYLLLTTSNELFDGCC